MVTPMPALWDQDPWLAPYRAAIEARHGRYVAKLDSMLKAHDLRNLRLSECANGHLHYGLHRLTRGTFKDPGSFVCRESAPSADALYLIGDFNQWNRRSHPFIRVDDHTWEIELSARDRLQHGQRYKIHVVSALGAQDRIPPYARWVVQDPKTLDFAAAVWDPPSPYRWQHSLVTNPDQKHRLIYEAHVGMAQERPGIGTYREFADLILPRIAEGGYETIQLMAVMEHPYYGSFGYHVANFFAPSSRFGTPDDLRYLVDQAHGRGLTVLLDVVHSHAVRNEREGLANFDGTMWQFFHAGPRGDHSLWGSKLFDYGRPEVVHFLLSNLKYWMEEFRFDGFRFDGVTSMLFHHHGIGTGFDHYDRYFDASVDEDAVTYLTLANHLVHEISPGAVTIAEDVSGMPGLAAPISSLGLGFDFRLAMGIPDFWIKIVQDKRDEDWSMGDLYRHMTDRRPGEPVVGYVESHDQALVGDKTMMFRMADAAMYHHMREDAPHLGVERAMALHKIMRLITLGAGSHAYLTFMGNEFGHPEWIDFPREGNSFSYQYARRQWSLVDHPKLRYRFLAAFDRSLMHLARETRLLNYDHQELILIHEDHKLLLWRRGPLLFAINLHPNMPQSNVSINWGGEFAGTTLTAILSTDDPAFGGYGRIKSGEKLALNKDPCQVYLPCRTGVVWNIQH